MKVEIEKNWQSHKLTLFKIWVFNYKSNKILDVKSEVFHSIFSLKNITRYDHYFIFMGEIHL